MSSKRPKKDELEANCKKGPQKKRSTREQLEVLARTDGYAKGDFKEEVSKILREIPVEAVASIAAQFSTTLTRFEAVDRAYQLLEMVAAAKQAMKSGHAYMSGMAMLEHHNVVDDLRRAREGEKIRAVGDLSAYGRPGPISENDAGKHYRFNDVLKNLMPKVERVLEREQRFIEWWAATNGIGEKEANATIAIWKKLKLIPVEVYKKAYPIWLDWWEDNISKIRGQVKRQAIEVERTAVQKANDETGREAALEGKQELAGKKRRKKPLLPRSR